MTDEEFMGRWFTKAVQPQLNRYNDRMAVASAYRNSPRWDRLRVEAQKEFHETTSAARELYELAMSDLMSLGEVSESTDYLLTQFEVAKIVQAQAAE